MVKRAATVDPPTLELCRSGASTLPAQLAAQLRDAIDCGRLPVGSRLPASRALADWLGVSRNIVLLAYEDLQADDVIEGRVGAGSYVVRGIALRLLHDPDGNRLLLRQRCDRA